MNLNVTLEFACYTQYGVYMYIFIYGKASGPTIPKPKQNQTQTKNQNKKKPKQKKKKQKQSLIIPITAFCGRVIFYTRECQKQQILYYYETQHQNNL